MQTSLSFVLPINKILEEGFKLRDENPDMSIEDMIKEILPTISLEISAIAPPTIKKKKIKSDDLEDKPKKRKEVTDEDRCMARTIYEDIHLEKNGTLKIMREDPNNLYGDRCKCRKKDSSKYCTRHSGFQPLGIWNGCYSGKFLDLKNKTENKIDLDKSKEKTKRSKKNESCLIEDDETSKSTSVKSIDTTSVKSIDTTSVKSIDTTSVKSIDTTSIKSDISINYSSNDEFKDECLIEDEEIETEPIEIDGIEYFIDSNDIVYTEDGDILGKYDHSKNKIIK